MSNPKHAPTPEQRKIVKAMVGYGVLQNDIATVIGIDPKTLRLHYADEIAKGGIEANAQVAQSLFKAATRDGNMTAAIWWTKIRMGWKETALMQHSGPDGGPILNKIVVSFRKPDA